MSRGVRSDSEAGPLQMLYGKISKEAPVKIQTREKGGLAPGVAVEFQRSGLTLKYSGSRASVNC